MFQLILFFSKIIPKKLIQKAINHSAIDVKVTNNDEIVEIKFCKEIHNNMIEFSDLNNTKDFTPIKIKKYNNKIWYLKNGIIYDNIDFNNSIPTDLKNVDIF